MHKTISAPIVHTNAAGVHMRTTIEMTGAPDLILEKAVKMGLAKSKTEALRMSVFSYNKEYNIVKDLEQELLARRIQAEQAEMKRKGERYLTEEEALAPYRHLFKKTKTK